MTAGGQWLTSTAVLLICSVELASQTTPPLSTAQNASELSCRTCHPGAVRGLQQSPHRSLLTAVGLADRTCASCHGDLTPHARAAGLGRPGPRIPVVQRAACAECHPGQDLPPGSGRHEVTMVGSGAPPLPQPGADTIQELAEAAAAPAVDWSAFAELGYRFVHRSGSDAGYATDLDLPSTALLRDFEVRGRGNELAPFDDLRVFGRDIGDPRWDAGAALHDADRFDVASTYRRASYHYEATGDFHRVDRDSRQWVTTASVGPATCQVFGRYEDQRDDGFWLTQRIGNRDLPVQTFIDGVASPRRLRGHEGELGVRGNLAGVRFLVAAGWFDERRRDRWRYSQPATANPGFTESEDLNTTSRLRGPTARALVARDDGDLQFEMSMQVRDIERRLATTGSGTGFDTAAFMTTTTGSGRGDGQLWVWRLDTWLRLTDVLSVAVSTRFRDYEERLGLDLVDVRSSTTAVTTTTRLDDRTSQRLFDGDVRLRLRPVESFDLGVGYGYANEQLRVAAPGPADPGDFRDGEIDDAGVVADLRYEFIEDWTLRAEGRDFATDGVALHELVPATSRLAELRLSWDGETASASAFARHRHNDNDVSGHRLDAFSTGCHTNITTESVTLAGSYTFSDVVSRTRTNLFFDPDPDPVPSIVGFFGDTHTWTLDAVFHPHERWQAELGGAVTRTTGSFRVDTADVRAGVLWRCCDQGAAGIEWRHVRYDDERDDDWQADLIFVYWRQEW